MPASPQWVLHPEMYAYNTELRKHYLKSGSKYRIGRRQNPSAWIETRSMVSEPIKPPVHLPLPTQPEPTEKKTLIGVPPAKPPPTMEELEEKKKKEENDRMRKEMAAMIKEELRQKPEQYADKDAGELSTMFRQMLIDKLTAANEAAATKTKAGARKQKPAVRPLVVSTVRRKYKVEEPEEEEDDDEPYEDEGESE
jgi:hypothetical protein